MTENYEPSNPLVVFLFAVGQSIRLIDNERIEGGPTIADDFLMLFQRHLDMIEDNSYLDAIERSLSEEDKSHVQFLGKTLKLVVSRGSPDLRLVDDS